MRVSEILSTQNIAEQADVKDAGLGRSGPTDWTPVAARMSDEEYAEEESV